jgi:hypothetical protein
VKGKAESAFKKLPRSGLVQQYISQNVGTLCYAECGMWNIEYPTFCLFFLFTCKLHALLLNYKSTQFKGLIMFPKDKDAQISRFWEKYIEKLKRYGIKQDLIRWHVKHAELYIKAHKTRLKEHTALDLDKYLQVKGRNTGLKDWQFCQVVDSLRILFIDVVASPWATSYPWDDLKSQARSLPASHPTIARQPLSDVSSVEVADTTTESIKAQFPDVFDAVIREIRSRNYSIRTEQSYIAWLSRFIRFHNQQHPKKLDANDIANYLTHLAVNRMVASSTQRV